MSHFKLSILPEAYPSINCFQALDYLYVGAAPTRVVCLTLLLSKVKLGVRIYC